ncbi:MAG: hypothetical protein OXG58_05005 [Gemmatimonadetes bacterium]|nr:hypothetical protein [Gemmatimonadota bacterium]MCY3944294.1 hypothetical protein [Gemmatimonadota bacterium]
MNATLGSEALVDAWALPSGSAPPTAFEQSRAGTVTLRYPKSDLHLQRRVIDSLRDARRALTALSNADLVEILGSVGEDFLRGPDADKIELIAQEAGLSIQMTEAVLEGMAPSWSRDGLAQLLAADLAAPRSLESFAEAGNRRIRALAPGVTLHFGAGSVPGLTATSMLRALLARSPVLVKPGAGDVVLTAIFARALQRADRRLRDAVAVLYWPGGARGWLEWERRGLAAVDQVVAYGQDETVESIRARTPATTRLVEHPDRLGVAIVDPAGDPDAASAAARAVAFFDQRGCVSTHLILLLADAAAARAWCGKLASQLAELGFALPPGPASSGELSRRRQLTLAAAVRIAASGDSGGTVGYWASRRARWAVLMGPVGAFAPVGGRTAWVVPVADIESCTNALAPLGRVLQTVGIAGIRSGRERLCEELAALGATRIAPLAQVPFPEPEWLHDGARPLGELIRWGEVR